MIRRLCHLLLLQATLLVLPTAAQDSVPRQVRLGESRVDGDTLVVPVVIDDLSGVLAGDIDLLFDSAAVSAITARSTELLAGFLFISNPVADTLKIAFASAQEVSSGSGAFCEILVEPAGAVPSLSFLMVSLNDGATPVDADPQTAVAGLPGAAPVVGPGLWPSTLGAVKRGHLRGHPQQTLKRLNQ